MPMPSSCGHRHRHVLLYLLIVIVGSASGLAVTAATDTDAVASEHNASASAVNHTLLEFDEYEDTDPAVPKRRERHMIITEHKNTSNPLNAPVGCVMRKVCGRHNKLSQNCAQHVYPVPIFNPKLLDLCPNVFSSRIFSSKSGAPACCDHEQVDILRTQMSLARDLLYKCPSCYSNFVNFWCHFSCSVKQQKFVKVTTTQIDEHSLTDIHGNLQPYVTRVKAWINKDYAQAIFDSCKDVRFAGGFAMDAICGESRQTCTTAKLFAFMGKADKVHVPFDIDFELTHKESLDDAGTRIVPLKVETLACHDVSPLTGTSCSCGDCVTACKNDFPFPMIEERTYGFKDTATCERVGAECRIASMECMSGLSVMAGGILAAVLMGSILVYYCMGKSTDSDLAAVNASPLAITAGHHLQLTRYQPGALPKKRTYRIDDRLIEWCQEYGRYAVDHTSKLLCGSLVVAIIFSLGLVEIRTTTDPVELWSNKESQLRKEKDFFDRTFSPFYRVEQLILAPRDENALLLPNLTRSNMDSYYGPVFNRTFLREAFILLDELLNLEAISPATGKPIKLNDICYKPMAPDNNNCAVMSIFSYFQNNLDNFNATGDDEFFDYDHHTHLTQCISGPFTMQTYLKLSCLSDFGAPIEPYVILGDFNSTNDYFSARGLVVTILLENNIDKALNEDAAAWELEFINRLKQKSSDVYSMSYMAERSIEDEIDRASSSDKITVIISYLFMFGYVAFALGQYKVIDNELTSLLVKSKFTLGIAGVLVVALSVTSSIGVFAFYGIPATMIILEVQPFLILAVGVDNIFLLVQAYQRHSIIDSNKESLKERVAIICGEVIPSMMLTTLSESACFFLGAITDMPAVKTFSLYAGLAILFNFAFQITCFLALFIMDIRRQESGRAEFLYWKQYNDVDPTTEESFMYRFFKSIYAPALLHSPVRMFTFIFFAAWFATSCYVMRDIRLGLDEKMAVPKDSYMLPHFNNMEKYMSVGPPVYFVIKGNLDYNDASINKLISGTATARQYSLGSQINHAARYPNNSYIGHPANSWIDDYTDWLRPGGDPPCCRFYKDNGTFCSATEPHDACDSCDVRYVNGRPDPKAFASRLSDFLLDNPSKKCTKGGKAQYGRSLDYHATRGIDASYFMTYHTPLKSQQDFIRAMDNARFIAKNITCTINHELAKLNRINGANHGKVEVFAYSPYYVFYEQYETIVWAAIVQLMLSLVVIFIVTFFLLGMDPWSAMIIVGTIACILINLIGLMYWWNIDFNAISVVNLVMSVGISVEFCSHIVRTYSLSMKRTRVERTHEALANIGCSVLSGITFTKFGGVMVLAFAHTQIFEIFYFRMFLGIVIIGGMHGLIFLPVLLSIVGPPLNKRRMQELLLADNGYYAANTRLHLGSPMSPKSSKSCSDAPGIKDVSVMQGLVFDNS